MHVPSRSAPRSKLKRELGQLVLARSDIATARNTCEIVLSEVSGIGDNLYAPLFNAVVVSYARPFVHGNSVPALSDKWNKFDDPRLQIVHEKLIRTRHELVAHSDSEVRRIKILRSGIPVTLGSNALINEGIGVTIDSYYYGRPVFLDALDSCTDLLGRISDRAHQLLNQLYDGLDLPHRPFTLRIDDGL